jgi:thiamine-phosphate pyrophosphorylase
VKSLYVTDRRTIGDARFIEILRALRGAPSLCVQLREKEACDREVLSWARRGREALGPEVPLFVNRRFDIALAAGADGTQLPSAGLPLARVRANTPRGFRIGVSTHSGEEAHRAIEDGADLVLLGPIFDTPSKRGYGPPLGPAVLKALPDPAGSRCKVFAIGGITEERLDALEPYRDRISGVAGIRLFQEASDPRGIAERIARA